MNDLAVLVVAILVAYLPGLALLSALGHRRPLPLVALAPAASIAVAGIMALVTAAPGLSYGPVALGIATLLLAAVPIVPLLRRARDQPFRLRLRLPPLRDLPDRVVGVAMVVVAVGFGMWSWLRGLGGFSTPPQEHDMIIHAMQTAYIMRSGRAAPWQLVPADVVTGEPVSFYPSGFHLLAGACADLTGDVVRSLNAMTVVFLAIVICTGVAALGVVAARQLGLGARSALPVGGLAALVVAGSYRPGFHLMHDGGILANAAALALVPGVVAGMLLLPRMRRPAAAGVGMAAAGAVWAHPTAAVSIVLTVLLWWAGQLVSPWGRRQLRGLFAPLLVAGLVGTVLLVPAVGPGLVTAGRTGAFPPDTVPVSFREALGSTFGFPYSGWLDQDQSRSQVWIVVLLVLGVGTVIALRRGLGVVFAWAGWSVIVMGAWLSPGTGPDALITGFYYNAMLRVWSHISLLAPVLAGLGVVLVADRSAVLLRRRLPVRARWTALALITAGFVGYALVPAVGYAELDEVSVASRYRTPDFVRIGPDDQAAINWLAGRIRPGERVFNSPNDGSTYLYVERGIPVVNVYSLGLPGVPYSYRLLEDFNTYPTDEAVRRQLRDLDVRWVYVDEQAPGIGSNGSPENWAGEGGFTLAPGLGDLAGLPGLTPAFRAGSVTVYALDLDAVGAGAPVLGTRLPPVDVAAAQARVAAGETVSPLNFARVGSTSVKGRVAGSTTAVWAVPVAAGQILKVDFLTADDDLSMNVIDVADIGGDAVHSGDLDGPDATIRAARDAVYLIRPVQPRAAAGRDSASSYTLTVSRS